MGPLISLLQAECRTNQNYVVWFSHIVAYGRADILTPAVEQGGSE